MIYPTECRVPEDRKDKEAFLSEQCTEIETKKKNQNGERLEISSRKLELPREHIIQEWAQ